VLAVVGAIGYFVWRTNSVFKYRWNWNTVWPFLFRFDEQTGHWVPNLLVEGTAHHAAAGVLGHPDLGRHRTLMGLAAHEQAALPALVGTSYVMLIRNIPPVVFVFVFVFFIASQIMPTARDRRARAADVARGTVVDRPAVRLR
jgi:polar amino acid transport system permease protein